MTVATVTDTASVDYFGGRSDALGFPLSDLSMSDADLAAFVARVLNRYSRIVNRLGQIEASCRVDVGWLPTLVDLDLGQPVRFTRRGIDPERILDGFVSGYEHRLTPNNFDTTIYTTTVTRSI